MSAEIPPNGKTRVYNENGQTCIPKEVRESLGIEAGDKLRAVADGNDVVFIPMCEDDTEK